MSKTVQEILNDGSSSNDVAVALGALRDTDGAGFGSMLAELFTPAWKVRTVDSSATQVEELPGAIVQVLDTAGTTNITIVSGTSDAGEVQISYTAGVPTLVFGSGAVTGYQVLKFEAPAGLAAKLALSFR
jgi:hypothetical protein